MGGCFSSSSSSSNSSSFNSVRVVHLNGYVEDFQQPVSVSQVTGDYPPKHFVFTALQLLSYSSKPLKRDTLLQPGHVYFKLPCSVLQADVSPVDLASLAKRLTAIAKTTTLSSLSPPRSSAGAVPENCGGMRNGRRTRRKGSTYRVEPWRPILETIGERSATRGSESDPQESS